jgi:hypothetical protein
MTAQAATCCRRLAGMRHRLLVSLAAVALVGSACAQTPETVVAGTGTATDTVVETTVPGQRQADEPTTTSRPENELPQAGPEEEFPVLEQANDPTSTVAPEVGREPDPTTELDDEPLRSWQDQPLARVVLTGDDLPALGLRSGWEVGWAEFIEIDDPGKNEERVCGTEAPGQTSYFTASFEHRESGTELNLNVMPATSDTSAASDFLNVLELLATCPNPEDEFAAVSMEIVTIDVEGADQSLVIAGTDATSPAEPIGLTLAAADVDGHLFMAFVAQDSGTPSSGDADLAVKALELSISRL